MAERGPLICSLVERGWRAVREYSLGPQQQDMLFLHVIKGRLSRPLRALIAPRANTRLASLPRQVFWLAAWCVLAGLAVSGRLRGILVDNEKSWRRLARFSRIARVPLSIVRSGTSRYELWAGTTLWPEEAWQAAVRQCASR